MWGVCLDLENAADLSSVVVRYEDNQNGGAVIISPESSSAPRLDKIKPLSDSPEFDYNARVSPTNHPEIEGKITRIYWHFDLKRYYYKIEINGKLKSKRYFSEDLISREV